MKEISDSKNIKNRLNRQNVQRLLTIINQKFSQINLHKHYQLGLFCFIGINEYSEEIIEFIEPEIKFNKLYYSCSNHFDVHITNKYIGIHLHGNLIFANGDECLCYQFKEGQFKKLFGINGNLIKRHKKGGYSANRYARIAEESRHNYIVRIVDKIKEIQDIQNEENNWIYGSEEIIINIIKQCPCKLKKGGFLTFDSRTIFNNSQWLNLLMKSQEKNYDKEYKEILEYLELNPDMLDFNYSNRETMKYYLEKKVEDVNKLKEKQIPLLMNSKYYAKLMNFQYIGVKYYQYEIEN